MAYTDWKEINQSAYRHVRETGAVWTLYGINKGKTTKNTKNPSDRGFYMMTHTTYEQRLEAICRIWWPKRFKQ